MPRRHTDRLQELLLFGALFAFALASVAMIGHSIDTPRQADMQLLTYAFQGLEALQHGTYIEYLLEVRKYPFLPVFLLSGLYGLTILGLIGAGRIESMAEIPAYVFLQGQEIDLVTRCAVFTMALLTLILLYRLTKRFFLQSSSLGAVLLLISGFLFPMFATAERPHMLIACMTMVAFACSLPLVHEKTTRNMFIAFTGSAAAFMTLQSGALTFLFPVLAFLSTPNGFAWKKLFSVRLILWSLVAVCVALLLGYPFVFDALLHGQMISFDLGNDYISDMPKWTGKGFVVLGVLLTGSEPFLLAAFLWYLFRVRSQRVSGGEKMLLIYLAAFVLIFGMYTGTSTRFFLPILPVMALLAARTIPAPKITLPLLSLFIIIVQIHNMRLAMQPNTFEQAKAFLVEETVGPIATTLPSPSFLGIYPTRQSASGSSAARDRYIAGLPTDLQGARDFVSVRDAQARVLVTLTDAPFPPSFTDLSVCKDIPSSPYNDVYLWAETDWPIVRWFQAKSLGPELTIYCR